jgi:urea transport system ATP-binding protein
MLTARNVNQYYGESHTLWDLNLEVPAGRTTCLMGRNGVGKTTFLKCAMGLLAVHDGEIRLGEVLLSGQPAERRARLGIGYVPTVEENLTLGLAAGVGDRAAVPEMLALFPVLGRMLRRRGGDLFGGQQQQLAIARALVLRPRLLILDEPTEGIQPNIVHEIGEVIMKLRDEHGITVLLVEQQLPFARRVADRFCILDKGRAVAAGDMHALSDEIVHAYLTV